MPRRPAPFRTHAPTAFLALLLVATCALNAPITSAQMHNCELGKLSDHLDGDRREVSLLLKECVLHPPNVGSTFNKLLNKAALILINIYCGVGLCIANDHGHRKSKEILRQLPDDDGYT